MWWCERYNRPLKDPLLQEYTLEELAYEYHIFSEKEEYRKELAEEEADKIEEEKIREDEEWANMMEAQLAQEQPKPKAEQKSVEAPVSDPNNAEWMEKHIQENKLYFGDDFGEDLSIDFNDPNKDK